MDEQAKMQRVFSLLLMLLFGKFNVAELQDRLGCSRSTVYRYIRLLENGGVQIDVKLDGSKRYFIASDNCPLCRKGVEHA